jgi:hypothetical protein
MYVAVYLILYPAGVGYMAAIVRRGLQPREEDIGEVGAGRPRTPIAEIASRRPSDQPHRRTDAMVIINRAIIQRPAPDAYRFATVLSPAIPLSLGPRVLSREPVARMKHWWQAAPPLPVHSIHVIEMF